MQKDININKIMSLPYVEKYELIKQNKYTDILVNDSNPDVRALLALNGHGLDILSNDINWFVRYQVAKQGYNLSKFINDEDDEIREFAIKYCKEHQDKPEYKNILILNNL